MCCWEHRVLPSAHRDLNRNKNCQSYDEMCQLFHSPFDYPPIVDPARLTYIPNPPLGVPPCQKIDVPPVVPIEERISLNGKNVLIIGGSKGNGKAVAERFAAEGAKVIATSRHPGCYAKPVGYELQQLDVRFEEQVRQFIQRIKYQFGGRLDILINCPKTLWLGPLADATGDDLLNNVEIDLIGYHRVTHYALPYMRHSNETRVLSFGSLAAYVPVVYAAGGYSMAKRGLQHWNDTMQVEELMKKAQGLVKFGPTFSLLEPFDTQTALGIAEYQRASSLGASDPLVLGARFLNAQDLLNGVPTSRVAELVFRVAVASQPGVRYAVIEDNQPLPDGTPLLAALQVLNAASADDAINLIQPLNAARIARIQGARTDTINGFCKGAGRTPQ